MTKHGSNQGYLIALVLAAACWGFGAVMTKYAVDQVPPLTLLVVQLIVSVVVLWIAVVVQGTPVRGSRDSVRLGLIGVLNPGLAYTFGLLGLAQTTASRSALLWAAEPILIIGFA
jgi:drug/metabolite transporter (DMT)-like permease